MDDEQYETPPDEEGEGEDGDLENLESGEVRTPKSLSKGSPAHRALGVLPPSVADAETDSTTSGEPILELTRRIREGGDGEETVADLLRIAKQTISRDLQQKLDRIGVRANIIRFKYDGYKKWHDVVQIFIICISTALSLLESVKAEFEVSRTGSTEARRAFTLLPIFMSSGIAVSLSLLKFKRYQEKMESMQKCIEKSIFITYRLKKIQESAKRASTADELESVYKEYTGEPYNIYNETQEEIERNLKFADLVRHMKTYHELTLEFQRSEAAFEANSFAIASERAAVRAPDVRLSPRTTRALARVRGDKPSVISRIFCCTKR